MRCPYCHAEQDRVVDSRSAQDGSVVRRRRQCLVCERRYTTYERIEDPPLKVVKRDGTRQDFAREKLLSGLRNASWKRPHVTDNHLEHLVTEVEEELHAEPRTEIQSRDLGQRVMAKLRQLDEVAYIRFASVYYDFRDVQEFVAAVTRLGTEGGSLKRSDPTTSDPPAVSQHPAIAE